MQEYYSFAHCVGGGSASIATSFIFTPSERIKQQMQVGSHYRNCWYASVLWIICTCHDIKLFALSLPLICVFVMNYIPFLLFIFTVSEDLVLLSICYLVVSNIYIMLRDPYYVFVSSWRPTFTGMFSQARPIKLF